MIRVTTEWTGSLGAPYYTTMHFRGTTSGEASAAANAVRVWLTQLQNRLSDDLTANVQDDVPSVDPVTGNILTMFTVPTSAVVMANAGEPLPQFTQGLFRIRTGVYYNGRELRGKVFIPGIVEADTTTGDPSASLLTALQTAWDFAFGTLPSTNQIGVWSPTNGVFAIQSGNGPWTKFAILRSRRD